MAEPRLSCAAISSPLLRCTRLYTPGSDPPRADTGPAWADSPRLPARSRSKRSPPATGCMHTNTPNAPRHRNRARKEE